jgi:hypothetical protein
MADEYYIKRGETVKGPFSAEKLQALKKAKKLKADDGVSEFRKGPWESFAEYEDEYSYEGYTEAVRRRPSEPKTAKRSSNRKKPSKSKKQSSRGMILGMSYYFLGATALVLALIAVVYVQFFSLESRADRLAERMIALSVQSEALINSIGQSEDIETIRARGARAEAKNLELGRVATELAQLQAQMDPEQRTRWEEKWTLKLLKLK